MGGSCERIVRRPDALDAVRDEGARAGPEPVPCGPKADPRRVRTVLDPEEYVPYLPGAVLLRAPRVGPARTL
ncbi:hypothetical protein [Streptomyces sp. KL116D]|uniref:hypothetical protein n=1 Tax=Streptomyces sp. KL116D TaxID=3045152 RepID=UPI0035579128